MKVKELIDGYKGKYGEIEVEGISFSPKNLKNGDMFFLLKPNEKYVKKAEKQAKIIVCEQEIACLVPTVKVQNARKTFALASKNFYGKACEKLKIIAITGTNGKTTTSYMLKSILSCAGKKVGVIGTNGIVIGETKYPSDMTTPDPDSLHQIFKFMANERVDYVIMEASAHALALDKLAGINFCITAFTNLSQDHLDFFADMKAYATAKLKLFDMKTDSIVTNSDDTLGREIAKKKNATAYTLSSVRNVRLFPQKSEFIVDVDGKDELFTVNLPGRYNIANALCASSCALALGVSVDCIRNGLSSLVRVDGRFNVIKTRNSYVIIDFAHTPDGLKKLLTTVREFTKNKLIAVFGCGGNRDKSKRPLMAQSASVADVIFITSDNPREEEPDDIIADVKKGIKREDIAKYYIVPERKEAIKQAILLLKDGDCLVVAGKGNERFIEIKGKKIAYNDEEYIKSLLGEK